MMNVLRAEEIIRAANIVDVRYRDRFVWLEDVDLVQNLSLIRYLDDQSIATVDVDKLVETQL
jgi:H-type small acid-soluble spore protein